MKAPRNAYFAVPPTDGGGCGRIADAGAFGGFPIVVDLARRLLALDPVGPVGLTDQM